jgi:hypothetical protein
MWQQFFDGLRKLILLQDQTDQNTAKIKEMQVELKTLSAVVRDLVYEVRGNKNDEAHERENMALRLQNELLKFERRLPPPV